MTSRAPLSLPLLAAAGLIVGVAVAVAVPRAAAAAKPFQAGPIWNNDDAKAKCPGVCSAAKLRWDGNWRTTKVGQASECDCAEGAAAPEAPKAAEPPKAPASGPRDCGTGADDPGCGTAKGGKLPMLGEEFKGAMTALKSEHNELTRQEMLGSMVASNTLTARQFGQLLDLFKNELTRMEVAKSLAKQVVDPQRTLAFATKFANGITKKEYVALMSNPDKPAEE